MKLLHLVCLFFIALPSTFGQETKSDVWPPADTFEFMESTIAKEFWTGGVIAWIDGEKTGIRGFGHLSRDRKKEVNGDTIFEIGSISKVFTTTILCRAIRDGKIKLSDTLRDALGKEAKLTPTMAKITIEELATHTSGLPRMPLNHKPKTNDDPYVDYGRKELFEFAANFIIDEKAKGTVAYSNLGMGLLGTTLEIVLDKNFDALVKDLITDPLSMKVTGASGEGDNQAHGHSGKISVAPWAFAALAGAGDLVSTANDMLLFGRACLNQSDSEVGKSIGVASRMRAKISDQMRVGLGWHSFEQDQRQVIWHNGGTGGFSSFLGFEKSSKRVFFAVVNSNGPEVTPLGFHSFFPAVPLPNLPNVVKLTDKELAPCVGRFRLDGGLILEVSLVDDFLTVTIPGQATYTLYPSALNEFFLLVAAARCHFIPGKNNDIAALVWSQGGVNQRAPRVEGKDKTVNVSVEDLNRLAGRYQLDKDNVITAIVVDDHLEARFTDQPFLKLRATSKSEFTFEIVDAKLSFELKESGKAKSVTIFQNTNEKRAVRIE